VVSPCLKDAGWRTCAVVETPKWANGRSIGPKGLGVDKRDDQAQFPPEWGAGRSAKVYKALAPPRGSTFSHEESGPAPLAPWMRGRTVLRRETISFAKRTIAGGIDVHEIRLKRMISLLSRSKGLRRGLHFVSLSLSRGNVERWSD